MDVTPPTIGRVVYLYDSRHVIKDKPFVGFVSDVNVDGNPLTINCGALWNAGDFILGGFQGVPHKSEISEAGVYWDWMPYQKAVISGEIPPNLHASKA